MHSDWWILMYIQKEHKRNREKYVQIELFQHGAMS